MMGMNGRQVETEEPDEDEDEPVVQQAAPEPARRRARRSDVGAVRPQTKPHVSQWQNKEADLMWGEILQRMNEDGRTPYEMKISVSHEENGGISKLCEIDGSTVMGDGGNSPSDALTQKVIDSVHLASGYPGPRKYLVRFLWKENSCVYGQGYLSLASPQQILSIRTRQNVDQTDFSPMPGGMPQPGMTPQTGMGRPPTPQGQPMPGGWYMYPPGYGGYSMPQTQESVRIAELEGSLQREREENARNRGMMEEIIRAQKENRAPNLPPPAVGLGAPPPQQIDIAAAIQKGVIEAVTLISGGQGLGAQQRSGLEASMVKTANTMLEGMMGAAMKIVSTSMERTIVGMGAPIEEAPEPAEIIPPPDPKDGLPFETIELDQKWPDGSKVGYARSRETGNIHPLGAIMSNPYVMAKGGEAVAKLAETLTEAIKHVGMAGPHVVKHIPQSAQPVGLGQASAPPQSGDVGFGSGWGQ